MISVCMITYNHEKYIEEALLSILTQNCNFAIEVIVADDCSIDGTEKKVKSIIHKHPKGDCIKYTRHATNKGLMNNFVHALTQCQGKYIALCEGDDYWIDSLKLQKQVDFLEANTQINICYHRANLLKNNELSLHAIPDPFHINIHSYKALLKHYNFITTASVVFRKPISFLFPKWFLNIAYGDLGLYKILSDSDDFYCINEIMSVYRIHDEGIYSSLSQLNMEKKYLTFYDVVYEDLKQEEKAIVKNKIIEKLISLSKLKFTNSKILQYFYYGYLRVKYFKR